MAKFRAELEIRPITNVQLRVALPIGDVIRFQELRATVRDMIGHKPPPAPLPVFAVGASRSKGVHNGYDGQSHGHG